MVENIDIDKVERKISKESAELQFNAILDYFDIEFSDLEIEDGEEAAQTMKNYLIRAICKGRLIVDMEGDFKVTQKLKFPTENTSIIVYEDKFAVAKVAMKKEKFDKEGIFMAALSGLPASEFIRLKGADETTKSRLATVFSMA